MDNNPLKPFLSWAGGKQFLVNHLVKHTVEDLNNCTYFEPFLGAGSLFFAIKPKKAILSDLNSHLIDCYKWIKRNPNKLYGLLLNHDKNNSNEYYYKIRDEFNCSLLKSTIEQAARFIYLNKSCFNGIYRVNKSGKFNVPYGKKENLNIPSLNTLVEINKLLKNTDLLTISYENIINMVKKNDFIYLDPPYPPLNGSSYFTHYTIDRFPINDQVKVARFASQLSKKGGRVLISNADTNDIRDLYIGWNIYSLEVTRYITCKTTRHKVCELMITNY